MLYEVITLYAIHEIGLVDRFAQEIERAVAHRLDRHRHVAVRNNFV